jgi:hypothetical protein
LFNGYLFIERGGYCSYVLKIELIEHMNGKRRRTDNHEFIDLFTMKTNE